MFLLAHISDPHLAPLPRPRVIELLGKRGLGLANWWLRREREHRTEVLDAVLADLAAQAPDHVAVTGDLVNIALPGEFATAADFLARLGPPERVSFVPGNHDAYVSAALARAHSHWRDYMSGDVAPVGPGEVFPYVRRRGPLALVGVSTAVATGPFMATGRIGSEQLGRLDEILADLAEAQLFRVVLLHHPPSGRSGDRLKRLVDAAAFRDVMRRRGADLILHGHIHVTSSVWLDGPGGGIPAVSVPSASATVFGEQPAGYNLFRIVQTSGRWNCEWFRRGLQDGTIVEIERRSLSRTADQGPCQ